MKNLWIGSTVLLGILAINNFIMWDRESEELSKMSIEYDNTLNELSRSYDREHELLTKNIQLLQEIEQLKREMEELQQVATETIHNDYETFTCTAYDLSVDSCGKTQTDKNYGVTANGTNLSKLTRGQAMTIAVDPSVIPLGSKVEVVFPKEYTHLNGVYTANDTGKAIKGKIIDLFMGDYGQATPHDDVWNFGRRKVKLRILEDGLDEN